MFNILRIPAAAPRVCGSTELMMAFVLGETKKPEPPPIKAMYAANTQYGDVGPMEVSPSKPREARRSRRVLKLPEPVAGILRDPHEGAAAGERGARRVEHVAPEGAETRRAAIGVHHHADDQFVAVNQPAMEG